MESRALASAGSSTGPVYEMVRRILGRRRAPGGGLLDVGCGTANLFPHVRGLVDRYAGADVVRHEGFPCDLPFYRVDLDSQRVGLGDEAADVVTCVETVEHLENPRALFRELTRLARPGGLLVVTTPNNLSLLSKLCLVLKNQFVMFQDGSYPAHITALLEIDLVRMARECGWREVAVDYSDSGRVPGTARHWPRRLGFRGRRFSDNVAVSGLKD